MDTNNFEIIKQSLGNVVYSQKTQEMANTRKIKYSICIKWINIVLVGLVLLMLFLQIFNPTVKEYLFLGVFITILEVLFLIFQLSFNPENDSTRHKSTANQLWLMREKHLNLLTDIKNETYSKDINSDKRDTLTQQLSEIYNHAPQTNHDDYNKASIALNGNEKPKADDEEMENFLPENLR